MLVDARELIRAVL